MTYPTLKREARFFDTYPWEYSVAELSSLFGIERESKLLQFGGKAEDVGIVECLWMLECHLRALSVVPYYRAGDFNTTTGKISSITGTDGVADLGFSGLLNLSVSNITHSTFPEIARVRNWIDAIRLDMKIDAFDWSAAVASGSAKMTPDLVKEMWYAAGLVYQSAQFDLPNTGILLNHATSFFGWAHDEYGPWQFFEEISGGYGKSYAYRSLRGFPEATRKEGVASYILFRHGGPISQTFYGNDKLYVAHTVDISSVSSAFFGNQGWFMHPNAGELADPYFCLNDPDITGEDGSRQIGIVEPSLSAYPTSGSGPVYCRFQIGTYYDMDHMTLFTSLEDQSPLCGLFSGSRGVYNDTYLWQVVISNPYS